MQMAHACRNNHINKLPKNIFSVKIIGMQKTSILQQSGCKEPIKMFLVFASGYAIGKKIGKIDFKAMSVCPSENHNIQRIKMLTR